MLKTLQRTVTTKYAYPRNVRNFCDSKLQDTINTYLSPQYVLKPPYHHICQIGDPILRLPADRVDLDDIKTVEFKKIVDHLILVMRKYNATGLAAPQIGLPIQLFALETTKEQCNFVVSQKNAGQVVEPVPLQVFINPTMKILDFNTTEYPECCASVCGFLAHVPRAKRIKISALDLSGKPFIWEAANWPAKVAQHEFDHLHGIMYTDKMDPKTFSCLNWEVVNRKAGKISIDFFPAKSKWRKLFFK